MGRVLPILFLVQIALCVAALISCLSAEEGDIKGLPRVGWVIIILLFPLVGSIAWFIAGRERYSKPKPSWRPGSGFPEAERPRRTVAPDDDPEFLKRLGHGQAEKDAARMAEEERELLRKWEEDLRRREEEMRNKKDKPED